MSRAGSPLRLDLFLVPVLIVAGILLGLASWYSVTGIVVVVIFAILAGGAVRDDLVVEAADQYGMVMVNSGMRWFLH